MKNIKPAFILRRSIRYDQLVDFAIILFSLYAFSRGSLGLAIPFSFWALLVALIIGLLIIFFVGKGKASRTRNTFFMLYVLCMILFWNNQDFQHGIFADAYFYATVLLIGIAVDSSKKNNDRLLNILIWSGIFYAFWTILSALIPAVYDQFILPTLRKFAPDTPRGNYMCGFTTHYSTNGMYLANGVIASIAKLYTQKRYGKISRKSVMALIVLSVGLLFCGKRGIFLCVLASFCMMFVLGRRGKGRVAKLMVFLAALSIAVYIASFWISPLMTIIQRFQTQISTGDISTGRFDIWAEAWEGFTSSPIFGHGWGWFRYNNTFGTDFHAHNCYLQWLCELGVLFSIPLFIMVGWNYYRSVKRCRSLNAGSDNVSADTQIYQMSVFSFMYQTYFLLFALEGTAFYEIQTVFIYFVCIVSVNKIISGQKRKAYA